MHAFVRRVCRHVVIVRSGPQAIAYGDPYVVQMTVKTRGPVGLIEAFTEMNLHDSYRHWSAITSALAAAGLRRLWWIRIKNGRRRIIKTHLNPPPA